MPLQLNVGLNRKVGEANYGSRGASINVEMEVESSLVTEPGKLQERIRQLFNIVRHSLTEELNGGHQNPTANGSHQEGAPQGQTNGRSNGSSPANNPPRAATQSQVKAIFAIARGQGLNVGQLLRERFQVGRADDLSLKQASQLIDELKKSAEQTGG